MGLFRIFWFLLFVRASSLVTDDMLLRASSLVTDYIYKAVLYCNLNPH